MSQLLLALTARQYMRFYSKYASEFWDNISPTQYIALMTFVAVCGYILMKTTK